MGASNKSYDCLGGIEKLNAGPIELLNEEQLRRLEWWVKNRGFCAHTANIVSLSRRIGTNRTMMSRFVNGVYHMSYSRWINSLRCEDAQRQWKRNPEITVDAMAMKCGFASRKYFDKVFKECVGMSASQFRQDLIGHIAEPSVADSEAPADSPMGGKMRFIVIGKRHKSIKFHLFRIKKYNFYEKHLCM